MKGHTLHLQSKDQIKLQRCSLLTQTGSYVSRLILLFDHCLHDCGTDLFLHLLPVLALKLLLGADERADGSSVCSLGSNG